MREPRFRDTILYKMLKSGSYVGGKLRDAAENYNTQKRKTYIEGTANTDPKLAPFREFNTGAHNDADSTGKQILGVLGDAAQLAKGTARRVVAPIAPTSRAMRSFSEDAGERLGRVFGDMFGKINANMSPYEDDDIVSLLNEKEEIELLNRETERLRRIARIQARKREKIREMTTQALRSPYL